MRVLLFARARELAGANALEIDVAAAATVGDVRRRLQDRCPKLAGLVARSAIAVNGEYGDDALTVPVGAEVALIPPVSGGVA